MAKRVICSNCGHVEKAKMRFTGSAGVAAVFWPLGTALLIVGIMFGFWYVGAALLVFAYIISRGVKIYFDCSKCRNQSTVLLPRKDYKKYKKTGELSLPGHLKKCPGCAEIIRLESIMCKHCGQLLQLKKCPHCSEMNPLKATVCKSCDRLPQHDRLEKGEEKAFEDFLSSLTDRPPKRREGDG